ncbi:MAG: CatB-related O-acetyltransferase [Campylobacterota bacterium]|nr:CatB-related O-acetyltransferase [Campylobacterota bacterium]
MENYFENPFSSQLLCKTINHPNIEVGPFTYYSGYYHKHSFMECVHYLLDKKGTDRLIIGNYCSIGSGVTFIMGGNQGHRVDWTSTFPFHFQANIFEKSTNGYLKYGDTTVGHDVWIGTEAMITAGVSIGTGAIIASRAVVTKDVPPYAVVGGNPAKVLKYRFDDEKIKQLLALEWWHWSEEKIKASMDFLCATPHESYMT